MSDKRLKHAIHNEKISKKLFEEREYLDWANTTAFYSALHYVQHKLLPSSYNGVHCECIDDVKKALNCKGKHEATNTMVQIGISSVSNEYSFLMNLSFTARYTYYNVDEEHSKLCQKFLKKIKDACTA